MRPVLVTETFVPMARTAELRLREHRLGKQDVLFSFPPGGQKRGLPHIFNVIALRGINKNKRRKIV